MNIEEKNLKLLIKHINHSKQSYIVQYQDRAINTRYFVKERVKRYYGTGFNVIRNFLIGRVLDTKIRKVVIDKSSGEVILDSKYNHVDNDVVYHNYKIEIRVKNSGWYSFYYGTKEEMEKAMEIVESEIYENNK